MHSIENSILWQELSEEESQLINAGGRWGFRGGKLRPVKRRFVCGKGRPNKYPSVFGPICADANCGIGNGEGEQDGDDFLII